MWKSLLLSFVPKSLKPEKHGKNQSVYLEDSNVYLFKDNLKICINSDTEYSTLTSLIILSIKCILKENIEFFQRQSKESYV